MPEISPSRTIQLTFNWTAPNGPGELSPAPAELLAPVIGPSQGLAQAAPPQLPAWDRVPISQPLWQAVEHGLFGVTVTGPIEPGADDIRDVTTEQARELVAILADLQAVQDAIRTGEDPRTRKRPRTPEAEARLREHLERESPRLTRAYADTLAAYAEAFGDDAASALDVWARKTVPDCTIPPGHRYDPGHPWHYFHDGDNAPPIPVEDIQADIDVGRFLGELPKNPAKRAARIRELLATERERVEQDKQRYREIVERGAESLSRYDREIAHSSDAMAVATALALTYNHLRYGLGRLAWLVERIGEVPRRTGSPV